jgi:hypothetical protein
MKVDRIGQAAAPQIASATESDHCSEPTPIQEDVQ